MRHARVLVLAAALLSGIPAIGSAQDDKRVHLNVGGGPTFIGSDVGDQIGDSTDFYIETRYHYVWGPTPTATNLPPGTTGPNGSANGAYWPLSFGFRF